MLFVFFCFIQIFLGQVVHFYGTLESFLDTRYVIREQELYLKLGIDIIWIVELSQDFFHENLKNYLICLNDKFNDSQIMCFVSLHKRML